MKYIRRLGNEAAHNSDIDFVILWVDFNEDVFLTKYVSASYFFANELPIDMAGITRRCRADESNMFASIMHNDYEVEKAADIIINKRYPEVCLNDAWESEDFDKAVLILNKAFEQVYSEKCEYEL